MTAFLKVTAAAFACLCIILWSLSRRNVTLIAARIAEQQRGEKPTLVHGSAHDVRPKDVSHRPLRVVCLSDTHSLHAKPNALQVPSGDLLLFGGDAGLAKEHDIVLFDAWLGSLPHPHKVVVLGNMDLLGTQAASDHTFLKNAHLLTDQVVDIAGYKIFGSPWTPEFYGAFQFNSTQSAVRHWQSLLPPDADIDILVTHGPPAGYGDETKGRHIGDEALLATVKLLHKPPLLWVVGHVHESWGQQHAVPHPNGEILLLNVAVAYLERGVQDAVPRVVLLSGDGVAVQHPHQGLQRELSRT